MKKFLLALTACVTSLMAFAQTPTITSFAPVSAQAGAAVVITGTNFDPTPNNNVVYFGATKAVVTVATATSLTATVPVGATYNKISVKCNNLISLSKENFIPTFSFCGSPDVNANSWLPAVNFISAANSSAGSEAIGDIDGDGKSEVLVVGHNGNGIQDSIHIFRNTSTPGIINTSSFAPKVGFAIGGSGNKITLADLDNDGKLDVIVSSQTLGASFQFHIFRNTSTTGVINASSLSTSVTIPVVNNGYPPKIFTGDIDADGKLDLVFTNNTQSVLVCRNISTVGSITPASFTADVAFLGVAGAGSSITDVAVSDIDGDGKTDIVTTNGDVHILRSTSTPGSITFAPLATFTTSASQPNLVLGDLDLDGKTDIIANSFTNVFSILKNNSTPGIINAGSFSAPINFSGRTSNLCDLDGDGLPDLVGATNNIIFTNSTTPGNINAASFSIRDTLTAINALNGGIGDLDGDGLPDLAFNFNFSPTNSGVSIAHRTASIPTARPDICMVTVDSTSTNNEIFWDKSLYPSLDSMVIYRETTSNIYKRIGAVHSSALSMFADTSRSIGPANGNPNIGTYRYKIQMRDNCGNYSPLSLWHNTVFFINSSGTFFWNEYKIEGTPTPTNPMTQFDLVRDDFAPTGNYNTVGTVAGTQTTLNDPFYVAYQNTADWRVFAYGLNCNPTLKLDGTNLMTLTKSRSNIKNNRISSIQDHSNSNTILLYPQPSTNLVTIELNTSQNSIEVELFNVLGELVANQKIQNTKSITINIEHLTPGIYTAVITADKEKALKKLIKN